MATFIPQYVNDDRLKRYLHELLIQLTFNHKRPVRLWRANSSRKIESHDANRVLDEFSYGVHSYIINFHKFFIFQDVNNGQGKKRMV